ncbi:hypothetical protein BKA80DRAFT_275792, partial [Phyllosticta citrichinensis]
MLLGLADGGRPPVGQRLGSSGLTTIWLGRRDCTEGGWNVRGWSGGCVGIAAVAGRDGWGALALVQLAWEYLGYV